mmetsp:Transcript_18195/g.54662  ORF Transcript_18195/g.54662 Transcript_18195/m.54662 type:complete len:144 (-) Transcript_18195:1968-2399(-)
MSNILFEDIFDIQELKQDHFDKVARMEARGENYEMRLSLDVNVDIYPLRVAQKVSLALASSIHSDGSVDQGAYDHRLHERQTLLDKYGYACYGKLFKCLNTKDGLIQIYASFGGLMMMLEGDPRNIQSIELDEHIYLLMRTLK